MRNAVTNRLYAHGSASIRDLDNPCMCKMDGSESNASRAALIVCPKCVRVFCGFLPNVPLAGTNIREAVYKLNSQQRAKVMFHFGVLK